MPCIGVSGLGVFFGQYSEESYLPPEACEVAAAFFHAYFPEPHSVYVDNRKAVLPFNVVEQYVPGGEVAVKYAGFVQRGGVSCESLHYVAAAVGVGVAKLVEASSVGAVQTYEIAGADYSEAAALHVGHGGRGLEAGAVHSECVFVCAQAFGLAYEGIYNAVENVGAAELLYHQLRAVFREYPEGVAVSFLQQPAGVERVFYVFGKGAQVFVVGVYENLLHSVIRDAHMRALR